MSVICWLVFWSTIDLHHYVSSWYITQWFYISIHNTIITIDKSSYHLLPYKDICCLVTKQCPSLCDPMDCSLPGSSVHGILQARMLKWVTISSSRRSSQPRDQTHAHIIIDYIPHAVIFIPVTHLFCYWTCVSLNFLHLFHSSPHPHAAATAAANSLQSCLTLCDPIDGSPPGSSFPGILQARTLEWVAISLSNAWKWKVKVKSLSHVLLLATPWTAAYQAPPSMGFSRQENWSGVPLSSPIQAPNF